MIGHTPVRPLIVVEADRRRFDTLVDRARRAGWSITENWAGASRPSVAIGTVTTREDAGCVVMCALNGQGVIVDGAATDPVMDELCDDLRRFGDVVHIVAGEPCAVLTDEQVDIVTLLDSGSRIAEIADAVHVSRRTLHRRLGEIRRVLGVESNARAVAEYFSGPSHLMIPPPPKS